MLLCTCILKIYPGENSGNLLTNQDNPIMFYEHKIGIFPSSTEIQSRAPQIKNKLIATN